MKQYEIEFRLNKIEKIVFMSENPIASTHCCSEASIIFTENNHQFLLDEKGAIRFNLECLIGVLAPAIENKLKLHGSIQKDIGYLYNDELQNKPKPDLIYEERTEIKRWIGEKYSLWYGEFPTWIYNNQAGEIIFEMTPYFPGRPTYPSKDELPTIEEIENSKWYDEWIKDYEPILIRIIPREVAQQWLDKANGILEQIEENIIRMRAEGKF